MFRGGAWSRRVTPAASREAGGGRRVLARGGHARASSWREVEDDWHRQSAGPARGAGPPAGLPGR